ncbi:hypothetical protein HNQ91_003020 [Filimonas zeae]|uniref:hypothetical protein n=1 Tax=Filimonas zeae TaxID=1737353 RepID=UPI00166403F1|nr:hypothetical protein [Filimonas zeae]MDR6339955.1 hypothetical protein [Filimonas zeae]
MEKERTEREKTKLLWAFVPAAVAAIWAIGYTFRVWPALVQERHHHPLKQIDTTVRQRDSLPDSLVPYSTPGQ